MLTLESLALCSQDLTAEIQKNRDSIQDNRQAISIHEEKLRQLQKQTGK